MAKGLDCKRLTQKGRLPWYKQNLMGPVKWPTYCDCYGFTIFVGCYENVYPLRTASSALACHRWLFHVLSCKLRIRAVKHTGLTTHCVQKGQRKKIAIERRFRAANTLGAEAPCNRTRIMVVRNFNSLVMTSLELLRSYRWRNEGFAFWSWKKQVHF